MTDTSDSSNIQSRVNYTDCQIAEALSPPEKQANKTYNYMLNLLPEYTKHKYSAPPEEVWRTYQKYEMQLTHPFAKYLQRDFGVKLDPTHFRSLLEDQTNTRLEIISIIQNVYITLKTLQKALEDVMRAYENNDRVRLSKERLIGVKTFFINLGKALGTDLQETEDVMTKLHIKKPSVESISYNAEQGEWPLVREHLSFMQYLWELYKILLRRCAPEAN